MFRGLELGFMGVSWGLEFRRRGFIRTKRGWFRDLEFGVRAESCEFRFQ